MTKIPRRPRVVLSDRSHRWPVAAGISISCPWWVRVKRRFAKITIWSTSSRGDFYSTRFFTRELIDYIEADRGDGKPFFAYLSYTAVHWPLQTACN
jgi:hypothetical protein